MKNTQQAELFLELMDKTIRSIEILKTEKDEECFEIITFNITNYFTNEKIENKLGFKYGANDFIMLLNKVMKLEEEAINEAMTHHLEDMSEILDMIG